MARRRTLAAVPTADLHREFLRRRGSVHRLQRRREQIAQRLLELDSEIESLGGSARGGAAPRGYGHGPRKRPRNDKNLVEALATLLDGKAMRVLEITEAVQQAGYRTTSPNFRTIVNQTLINSGRFKRVGRGTYTAK